MDSGCRLSPHDLRDFKLKTASVGTAALPEEYVCDLKAPVKNQKRVSSCTAHAVSSILEHHAEGKYKLSTNFLYGAKRSVCNHTGKGMYLRDACKIVTDYGDMLLEDCSGNTEVPKCYDIAEEALCDAAKLERATAFRVLKYFSCSSVEDIKYAIYNHGPVLASMKWYYNTFKVDKNGRLIGEQTGDHFYHAVMVYGYTPEGFWCQNSWGTGWGKKGRFFVPNSIKFTEVRGFVDLANNAELEDLIEPKRTYILNFFYKCINFILNLFKKD